jgi:hypothetical protein
VGTDETRAPGCTMLQIMEARSDAEVWALTADRIALDLDLLFWSILAVHAVWKGGVQALQAKQWLLHVALQHGDRLVEGQCLYDLARLQTETPAAEAQWRRCLTQWQRHWQALLKHQLPEELHNDLEAMAEAEGRSLFCQIVLVLRDGVARWQAQHAQA